MTTRKSRTSQRRPKARRAAPIPMARKMNMTTLSRYPSRSRCVSENRLMLTISKPLSSSQAQTYHAKEFMSAEQNYWKQDDRTLGEWHGKLAEKFSLAGG